MGKPRAKKKLTSAEHVLRRCSQTTDCVQSHSALLEVGKAKCNKESKNETVQDLQSEATSKKHHTTPLKDKNKAAKHTTEADVHNAASTPVTPRSRLSRNKVVTPPSASLAWACSQEPPELTWEYKSPKNRRVISRSTRNMTLRDLTKNIHDGNDNTSLCHVMEEEEDSLLLEKWISKQHSSPASQRLRQKILQRKRMLKRSRHHVPNNIKMIFSSLGETGQNIDSPKEVCSASICENVSEVSHNKESPTLLQHMNDDLNKSNLLSEIIEDGDSADEMWGSSSEADDAILVEATQNLESCLISPRTSLHKEKLSEGLTFIATIPETLKNTPIENEFHSKHKNPSQLKAYSETFLEFRKPVSPHVEKSCHEMANPPSNCKVDELNNEVCDNEWEDELDDSFFESEALSQIPEDILSGKVVTCDSAVSLSEHNSKEKNYKNTHAHTKPNKANGQSSKSNNQMDSIPKLKLKEELIDLTVTKSSLIKTFISNQKAEINRKDINITTSNEDSLLDSDTDLFITNSVQPEDWSWLDDVESQECESLRCTPEEIAQKKESALQKLKQRKGDHKR